MDKMWCGADFVDKNILLSHLALPLIRVQQVLQYQRLVEEPKHVIMEGKLLSCIEI